MTDFFTNGVPAQGVLLGTELVPMDLPDGTSVSASTAQIAALGPGLPVRFKLTGSGSFVVPAGAKRLRLRLLGAGGGGGGATNGGGTVIGAVGTDTNFSTITAKGGSPGALAGGAGGTGGADGIGNSAIRVPGNGGGAGFEGVATTGLVTNPASGLGGASWLGGVAPGTTSGGTGESPAVNTGSGGNGACAGGGPTNFQSAGGGGAGEELDIWVDAPVGPYAWTTGTGGAGGVSSQNGGRGADGVILVEVQFG